MPVHCARPVTVLVDNASASNPKLDPHQSHFGAVGSESTLMLFLRVQVVIPRHRVVLVHKSSRPAIKPGWALGAWASGWEMLASRETVL